MALDNTSACARLLNPATNVKTFKLLGPALYALGISSLGLVTIEPASADMSFNGIALCTRSGLGASDKAYTCTITKPNGGQAIINGVPAAKNNAEPDYQALNDWVEANLGSNSNILGDMTSSAANNSVAIGVGATANTNNSVALGNGSKTEAVVGTTSATIAGTKYDFAGGAPTGTVSVGSKNNERSITNVAAGRLSETSTDAVNGSQLHATNKAVEKLDNIAVKYDENPDGTKANSITLAGGDPNKPVVITNVAAGKNDTDAVNVSQLNSIVTSTYSQTYSYVDASVNNAINITKNYTDQKFNELNSSLDGVRDDANRAAAIGLAAASLRYDDNPGKFSIAAGGGLWRSQSAFAFGAGYTNEDSNIRANISGTTSGGHWGVGAGLSFTLN